MLTPVRNLVILAAALAGAAACLHPPTHAVVTVEDPDHLADGAVTLGVGEELDHLKWADLDGRALPVTFVHTGNDGERILLWVEAAGADHQALARGRAVLELSANRSGSTVVTLAPVCRDDADVTGGCALADGSGNHGVCRAAECVNSVCGDGFVDAAAGEECEDGNANPNDGCDGCRETHWTASVVLGQGEGQGDALATNIGAPEFLALDRRGNLFLADSLAPRVFRVDHASGRITHFAGTGQLTIGGDGGPARGAGLGMIGGLATDRYGNVYVGARWLQPAAEEAFVRRIDADTGLIETVAGGGFDDSDPNGRPPTEAHLRGFPAVVVTGDDTIWFSTADSLFRIDPTTGLLQRIAGGGTETATDRAQLLSVKLVITALVFDASGRPIVIDTSQAFGDNINYNDRIFRLEILPGGDPTAPTAVLTKLAGGGIVTLGTTVELGDGGPAVDAKLAAQGGLAIDAAGRLYVSQRSSRIRRIDLTTGMIDTVIGGAVAGSAGDGGPASAAQISEPAGLTFDAAGGLWIADSGNFRIRVVGNDGIITSVVGSGTFLYAADGGSALAGQTPNNTGVLVEGPGRFLAAQSTGLRLIDCADPTAPWTCRSHATTPELTGYFQADGPVNGMILLADGSILATRGLSFVRILRPDHDDPATWQVVRLAGSEAPGAAVDGPLASAGFGARFGLVEDHSGHAYFLEVDNRLLRRLDLVDPLDPGTWMVDTVAGSAGECLDPSSGACGDDGASLAATFYGLDYSLAVDSLDRIYIADYMRIRRVELSDPSDPTSGTITAFAGTGRDCDVEGCGTDGPASTAGIGWLTGIGVDGQDRVYFGGFSNDVRYVEPDTGFVRAFMGQGIVADTGDFGPPAAGALRWPNAFVQGDDGGLWIPARRAVRKVVFRTPGDNTSAVVYTLAGDMLTGDGPTALATLAVPTAVADISVLGDRSVLAIADGVSGRVRRWDVAAGYVDTLLGYNGSAIQVGAASVPAPKAAAEGEIAGLAYFPGDQVLFVANRGLHTIERIDLSTEAPPVVRLAGTAGTPDYRAGRLSESLFNEPTGLAWDAGHSLLYVADSGNHVIRQVDAANDRVEVVAGTPRRAGFFGEGDPASEALLSAPTAVTLGASASRTGGSLFIADTGNHRIRRVDLDTGFITTVLGTGSAGSAGEGAPANAFSVDSPRGLAFDGYGNLLVSSRTALRLVTPTNGVVDGTGAALTIYGAPPRLGFPEAITSCVSDVVVLPTNEALLVSDACAGLVVRLDRQRATP